MASRKKVVLALIAVVLCGVMVSGCQSNRYSDMENDVYNCVNKFSRKVPKGFVNIQSPSDNMIGCRDPEVDVDEIRGKGRVVINTFENGKKSIAAGYANLDEAKPWIEGDVDDTKEMKPGSLIYFAYVNAESGPMSGEVVALLKDMLNTVVYVKNKDNQWRKTEVPASEWFEEGPFGWLEHIGKRPGETVPQSNVDRYIRLADRLSKTYGGSRPSVPGRTRAEKSTGQDTLPVTANIEVNTVWQGICSQPGYKPYPMIMFVNKRSGNTINGVNWYPPCDMSRFHGGLIGFSGQIGPGNAIRFTEGKVLSGSAIGGSTYTGTIDGGTLRGRWRGGSVVGEILLESGLSSAKTLESSEPFELNSIWKGTFSQPQQGWEPYPMVMFVNRREGDIVEGFNWYPICDLSKGSGGLIRFIGKVGANNTISFEEREIIYGKLSTQVRCEAKLKGGALEGDWSWTDPRSGKVTKGGFLLKRAD